MNVLLVHGMWRTPLSLGRLARFLRRQGHRVERMGYVAALESFERIRRRARRRLERLAATGEPYAVVGHSLGGVALRAAMEGLVVPPPAHLVLLATPNRPPRLACRLHRLWPYRLLCGDSGQLLASSAFFASLPAPPSPYTVISGTAGPRGQRSPFGQESNDWLVTVEETLVAPGDRALLLPVGHTFMMNDRGVQAAVGRALESGEGWD